MERNGDVIVGNWFDDQGQWYPLKVSCLHH
jgi:hypothetical protein